MTAETSVVVHIGSEVSAQVLANASNTVAHIATSTPDIGFWQEIIKFVTSWI